MFGGEPSMTESEGPAEDATETTEEPKDRGPYYVEHLDKSVQNIAVQLSDEQLSRLGQQCFEDYSLDVESCKEYFAERANYTKAFSGKTDPRPNGIANVHVPMITVGNSQYAARALEALVPTKGLVNIKATGGEDERRAQRVERHMNFQLQLQVEDFLQEMDVCLMEQGLYGSVFRKSYWDTHKNRVAIVTIPASDVVISYTYRGPIEKARRITHILRMTRDDIRQRVRDGVFCECGWDLDGSNLSFPENEPRHEAEKTDGTTKVMPRRSEDGTREVLEMHCRVDLEGTGVQQPYVVTVDYETKKVLRITSREYTDEKGQRKEICYFVHYLFMPGPGFYGQGLGMLLYGLQAAGDTLANQLVDAGTYANNPIHLVQERSNMPKGTLHNERGKFIPFDGTSEDISKSIFRIDFPEASSTLFQMLGSVQEWAQRISSVTDLMQGLEQPTNQTATATLTLTEQGLKLFSAVHKRTRAAFTNELKLIYLLNRLHLSDDEYSAVLGTDLPEYQQWQQAQQMKQQLVPVLQVAQQGNPQAIAMLNQIPPEVLQTVLSVPEHPFSVALDYADGVDVIPVADPAIASRAEKLILAKEAFSIVAQVPTSAQNPFAIREAAHRMLEAMGVQDIDAILPPVPPPPPPPDNPQEVENAMFFAEQMSPVPDGKPLDYDQEHLAVMTQFENEGFYEMLSPGGKKQFDQHRRLHLANEYLKSHLKGAQSGLQPGVSVPPSGPAPGGAGGFGVAPAMGGVDPGSLLPPTAGSGEALDNAPSSLLGRFPDLAAQGGNPGPG